MANTSIVLFENNVAAFVKVVDDEIRITASGAWITLSREEAAQLAVGLLNAAEAVPVEQGVEA